MRTVLVAAGLALAAVSAAAAARPVPAEADVRMLDYEFAPRYAYVRPSGTIHLANDGAEPHSMTSADDRDLFHAVVQPGGTASLRAPAVEGAFGFYCVFHAGPDTDPADGMAGVLNVRTEIEDEAEKPDDPAVGLAAAAIGLLAALLLARARGRLR